MTDNVQQTVEKMIHEMSNRNPELREKCRLELVQDRLKYGNEQTGTRRGIEWKTMRVEVMGHWCGYYYPDRDLTEEEIAHINTIAHGGLTALHGFDCSHWNDYPACGDDGMKYRDFPYVQDILFQIIDYIKR